MLPELRSLPLRPVLPLPVLLPRPESPLLISWSELLPMFPDCEPLCEPLVPWLWLPKPLELRSELPMLPELELP